MPPPPRVLQVPERLAEATSEATSKAYVKLKARLMHVARLDVVEDARLVSMNGARHQLGGRGDVHRQNLDTDSDSDVLEVVSASSSLTRSGERVPPRVAALRTTARDDLGRDERPDAVVAALTLGEISWVILADGRSQRRVRRPPLSGVEAAAPAAVVLPED
jgi:hypothetical protein